MEDVRWKMVDVLKNSVFTVTLWLIFFSSINITYSQAIDSLISEMVNNNSQLHAYQYKIKSAELNAKSVNNLPPPTIGVEFAQVPIEEINIWDKALSQNFFISQMFPIGGKPSAMYDAELKKSDLAKDEYNTLKISLIYKLKSMYYSIGTMQEKLKVMNRYKEILEQLYQSALIKFETGYLKQSDLLMIKSDVELYSLKIESMRTELNSDYLMINYLLGRNSTSEKVRIEFNQLTDADLVKAKEMINNFTYSSPVLNRMKNMQSMTELEINANNKELIPDLMLQGMIMRMPRGMLLTSQSDLHMAGSENKVEVMYGLMASITLPFAPWSSGKYSYRVEELKVKIMEIESERINMEKEINADLNSRLLKLQFAMRQNGILKNVRDNYFLNSFDALLSEFMSSGTGLDKYISNINMTLMNLMDNYDSYYQSLLSLAEIEFLTGYYTEEIK